MLGITTWDGKSPLLAKIAWPRSKLKLTLLFLRPFFTLALEAILANPSHCAALCLRRFMEQQADGDGSPKQEAASSKGGSIVSSASRDGLYRHFDKLTKEEQLAVLRDALGRKDRLDKLENASEKFDDAALSGLSAQAKAEKLIQVR